MTAAKPQPAATWPEPPPGGYTVDDLFNLPDLPPHTELIDGSLVFVSPQRYFHSLAVDLLVHGLRRTAPRNLRVTREMAVVLSKQTVPEPDVMVIRAEAAARGRLLTRFEVGDILLAVEVVSPDSEERDRDTKPGKYAAARIPHFWRVEMTAAGEYPVVHVYELDEETKSYVLTGIYHDRLKLPVPFPIDIDLLDIDTI